MTEDVIVIGGGFAGLCAANRCAEHGLQVLVLEAGEEELYWCNSRITTGALHVAFLSPREAETTLFNAIMASSGGTARTDLAQAIASRASITIDWMVEAGAQFADHPRRSNGVQMIAPLREMRAGLDWEESGPNLFLQHLEDRLVELGGRIRRGVRVNAIKRDELRTTGVVVKGETITARAIVIADGGFQANDKLIARYITGDASRLQRRNAGTGCGDGIRMAVEVGAATVGLKTFYGHVLSRDAIKKETLWPYPQVDLICTQSIVVNPAGQRFADEGRGGIYMANAIAQLGDPLSATAIFDDTVWEDAKISDNVPPNPSLQDAGGTVFQAKDLSTLAKLANIDPQGLAVTVEGFNAFLCQDEVQNNVPERTTDYIKASIIRQPPFYAIPLCAGITVTSGGISVNGRGQVIDQEDIPIPGLYAAGSTVGGIEGGPNAGYVGGLIKSFGIGLIAADSIATTMCQ